MKVKLDENMPQTLADMMRSAGIDVSTVPEESLSGAADELVMKMASAEGRLLMTFDADFGDVRAFPPGTHAGIVVFNLQDQRWVALKGPVEALLVSKVLDRLRGGLAVVDEDRIRLRFKGNAQ